MYIMHILSSTENICTRYVSNNEAFVQLSYWSITIRAMSNCAAIYKHLLSDKQQFGLTHNLLATKVMPSLIPHSVSPGLNIEQVGYHSTAKFS